MRGKMRLSAAGILLFLLLCSACAGDTKREERPGTEQSETEEIQMSGQKLDEYGMTEDTVNGVTLQSGKVWENLTAVGTEDTVYCNLQENVKGMDDLALLCADPVYGITYYVNYGYDYFIYGKKDGVCEPVVELPARRLFCRQGKVYFLIDSYQLFSLNGVQEGDICEYDPLSGEVRVIIQDAASTMIVYQEGIYYKKISLEEASDQEGDSFAVPTYQYRYSFNTGETEAVDINNTLLRCGDSFIVNETGPYVGDDEYMNELAKDHEVSMITAVHLVSEDGLQTRELEQLAVNYRYCVYQDQIYYVKENGNKSTLVSYDVSKMEEREIPLINQENYSDYIFYNDQLIFSDLLTVSMDGKAQSRGDTEGSITAFELYTDGINVYGICGKVGASIGTAQIQMLKKDPNEENNLLITQEDGTEMLLFQVLVLPMEE